MRTLALFLAVILLLPATCGATANWWSTSPYDALEIYNGDADHCSMKSKPVTLANSDFLVLYGLNYMQQVPPVWWCYLQRITPLGLKLWGAEGIRLCDASDSMQSQGRMVSDDQGGAIAAWWDARAGGPTIYEMYGQRISADGEFLWDPAGVHLFTPINWIQNTSFDICKDGEGGAYLAWAQEALQNDIYAIRIDSTGNPVWPQPVPVCTAEEHQKKPIIALREGGGCYILWQDYRYGVTYGEQSGQYFDPDGIPQWQSNGIHFDITSGDHPKILSDGEGGFLFKSNTQVMRVNEAGQIQWLEYIALYPSFRGSSDFALTPDGRIYVTFSDNRYEPYYYHRDVFAQCFDLQGNYLWPQEGVLLVRAPGDTGGAYLTLRENGFITVFVDCRNPTTTPDRYYQVVDSSGQTIFGYDGAPFYIAPDSHPLEQVISDGEGGMVAFWTKMAFNCPLFYANRIMEDGTLGFKNRRHFEPQINIDGLVEVSPGIIQYVLPEAGRISLELYDVLGRRVNLIEEGYRRAGSHVVHIPNQNLASGIYILRLSTPFGCTTHKMVIIR
jgi:hypothetical protein